VARKGAARGVIAWRDYMKMQQPEEVFDRVSA